MIYKPVVHICVFWKSGLKEHLKYTTPRYPHCVNKIHTLKTSQSGDIDINMYNAHFNLITIWPSKCYLNEPVSFQLNNVRGEKHSRVKKENYRY